MKESGLNAIHVTDFDSITMRELLRFIYCEEVQDLIYAAEKYEVDGLKEICIDDLAANVSDKNVIETLIIADQISGSEKLVEKCIPIDTM
jgi:hypothetical protein